MDGIHGLCLSLLLNELALYCLGARSNSLPTTQQLLSFFKSDVSLCLSAGLFLALAMLGSVQCNSKAHKA